MSSQAELIAWGASRLSTLEGDEGGATPVAEARYLLTWALGVDSLLFAPPARFLRPTRPPTAPQSPNVPFATREAM